MDTNEPLRLNTPPAVPLLDIKDLTVEFATRRGIVRAVKNIDLQVAKGETVGIVGESGSGKSVTSFAVMRILDRAGRIADGSVMFSGVDVRAASDDQMRDSVLGHLCGHDGHNGGVGNHACLHGVDANILQHRINLQRDEVRRQFKDPLDADGVLCRDGR